MSDEETIEELDGVQEPKNAEEPAPDADIVKEYKDMLDRQQATIELQDKRIDSLIEQIGKLVANGAQYQPSAKEPDKIEGAAGYREYEPITAEKLRL